MSQNVAPSLSQYFGSDEASDQADFGTEETLLIDNKSDDNPKIVSKNEPEVCRLFASTSSQPKDPTAAFFDIISNNPTKSGQTAEFISDLGMNSHQVNIFFI